MMTYIYHADYEEWNPEDEDFENKRSTKYERLRDAKKEAVRFLDDHPDADLVTEEGDPEMGVRAFESYIDKKEDGREYYFSIWREEVP